MALKDYIQSVREVPAGNTTFTVRALSTADILYLTKDHFMELAAFYGRIVVLESSGKLNPEEVMSSSFSFLQELPGLMADALIMATEAKDAEEIAIVNKLPLTIQLDALTAVFELTVTEGGGVKKLRESWGKLAGQIRPIVTGTEESPTEAKVEKSQTSVSG